MSIFICSGLFHSCSDDIVNTSSESNQLRSDFEEEGGDNFVRDDVYNESEIVLGEKRLNPFAIENINEAKNFIYGESMEDKILTHIYVEFNPTTQEHLAILQDWELETQVGLFDYDLLYRVESDGEHYINPQLEDPLYTARFAAIPEEVELPEVPYQVIDDLFLDKSDLLLLAQSFFITDNSDDINGYLFSGGLTESQVNEMEPQAIEILEIPPMPTTPCFESGYTWQLIQDDLFVNGQLSYIWVCQPTLPPPPPPKNECGCTFPNNITYASGCVRVQNIGGMIPVQIATVKVNDNWFWNYFTTTNTSGCWRINHSFSSKIKITVEFKNANVKAKDAGHWGSVRILRDYVGKFNNPPYNNVLVDYFSENTANSSKGRKYWAAAHTLNTVNNYRTRVSADGVPLPKPGLNWINIAGTGQGSAPMVQGVVFNSWPAFVAAFIPGVNVLMALTTHLTPDITNKYSTGETAASFNRVGYHELGHASHYSLVGEGYWFGYRNHIINNGGYGSFGNFNPGSSPGRVALGEAVAHYVMAKYDGDDNTDAEDNDFGNGFIPEGLLWDLEDDAPDWILNPVNGANPVDIISGFTPSMLFDGLTPTSTNSVQSVRAFRDNLSVLHLNTVANNSNNPLFLMHYNVLVDAWDVFN